MSALAAIGRVLELGFDMTKNVTIVRFNKDLEETYQRLHDLEARWKNIDVLDASRAYNTSMLGCYWAHLNH